MCCSPFINRLCLNLSRYLSNSCSYDLLPSVCPGSQAKDSLVAKCLKINGKIHPRVTGVLMLI